MISRSESRGSDRSGRIVRFAVVGSVLVHLLLLLVAFGVSEALDRVLSPHAVKRPKPDDETVTLSTAIRFEKRPQAAATHAHAPSASAPRRSIEAVPRAAPAVAFAPRAVRHVTPVAPRRRSELAKIVPRATPPPQLARATATAPPAQPRTLALAPQPPARAAERAGRTALSAARLAQIQNDLASSIAKDRARENPLSNVAHRVNPASTMRRFTINFAGRGDTLRGAEGLCTPLRMWAAAGYVYFNVICRTQHPDGNVRNEVIPWPLRFRPDQISYGPEGPAPPPGAIPLPPPGWKPQASQYIDPDIVDFLHQYGYSV